MKTVDARFLFLKALHRRFLSHKFVRGARGRHRAQRAKIHHRAATGDPLTSYSFNAGWKVPEDQPLRQPARRHERDHHPSRRCDAGQAALQQATSNAYYPGGAFEYSKSFEVPESWRGKRITVEFQGVYRDAMVYLNGDYVAQRPNGYATFVWSH